MVGLALGREHAVGELHRSMHRHLELADAAQAQQTAHTHDEQGIPQCVSWCVGQTVGAGRCAHLSPRDSTSGSSVRIASRASSLEQ